MDYFLIITTNNMFTCQTLFDVAIYSMVQFIAYDKDPFSIYNYTGAYN